FLRSVFEPLGYEVAAERRPLDERFPEWGDSPSFVVTVRKTTTLAELLSHLYVLVPVFDGRKHYFVGEAELEKLLAHGERWRAAHRERDEIARRYLKYQPSLYREAMSRLVPEEESTAPPAEDDALDAKLSLNEQRIGAVVAALRTTGARRVLDLGCGEGRLIRE